MSISNARALLAEANTESDRIRRHLLVAAALGEMLESNPIVVGGQRRGLLHRRPLPAGGLPDDLIEQTTKAVDSFTPDFRRAVTDQRSFGPSKRIANAMEAAGITIGDQEAMDAWIKEFNARPFEERDEFFTALSDED